MINVKETILIDQPNLKMSYLVDKDIIYLNWIGFQTEEQIISTGLKILNIFRGHDCKKVLNDNREVRGPWNTASKWTEEYWFPHMATAGLQKFAWIFPEGVFASLSAEEAMPISPIIKKFDSFKDGLDWLTK
ncbi:hypothetical protein [Marinigracilibium pacificum]|uniref:STAS/SEC14 domain-containing protein n=1 Tax=Marinigracilibium pacificum TaxID=2729599 RepID=A0A848IWT5_9BACT|nr:hypothetical protein [Marinigracilibium pacificum]NMM48993.1 hypothetical protein [Marinigracilibium pacificum]